VCLAAGLVVALVASCSAPATETAPDDFSQVAPGTAGGAPDTGAACVVIESQQPDACRIAWACPDTGRLTFVCFNEAAGMGCGCMVDEEFTDATTTDLSACGDDTALAALARETCGWDVP
jgi:hypothetical protein